MEIQGAFQIARREWENIKISLEMCGEIGEFNLKSYVNTNPDLIKNLIKMENKIPVYDYLTLEAACVFTELASKAGERIGLVGQFAKIFGGGYSWVPTGWFDPNWLDLSSTDDLKDHIIKQIFFFKFFFPLPQEDFSWDFDSLPVKEKLKLIFDKFIEWQSNPQNYAKDLRDYKFKLDPLWHDLSLVLDSPLGQC